MLTTTSLVLRIGQRDILRDASLTFRPGEMTAILGPNGAGKSTLLAVLSGEKPPASGQVLLDGQPLSHWRPAALARRRAVMLQHSPLGFAFTVEEVVGLGQSHLPHPRPADIARCLEQADAAALRGRLYPTLSGGEKQRVQFARALAQLAPHHGPEAPILLLDEPTASLDPGHQHLLLNAARDWTRQHQAITIAVLHDINLASWYCDRAILLHQNGVAWQESLDGIPTSLLKDAYGIFFHRFPSPHSARSSFLPCPAT
ncbi:iron complex transport system ATP-binding protein [Insolitispirillum peregrinum]|uniref:Iron complex transport system ATP-binding protein n=2 Tax=Insolitispirillum peregrinum TaxID=80876 RepID=A0A1N7L5V7_9PROT|nr:heme ABC transporter ATP-binding protein [Insolitispirillum peregrinum]SIS69204.1 iron complex transport system ATP-binding protein [Insolitispirillum peregrinum]